MIKSKIRQTLQKNGKGQEHKDWAHNGQEHNDYANIVENTEGKKTKIRQTLQKMQRTKVKWNIV